MADTFQTKWFWDKSILIQNHHVRYKFLSLIPEHYFDKLVDSVSQLGQVINWKDSLVHKFGAVTALGTAIRSSLQWAFNYILFFMSKCSTKFELKVL